MAHYYGVHKFYSIINYAIETLYSILTFNYTEPEDSMTPVPSKRIQVGQTTYILYHGQISWLEAVTFCRSQGARLAILKNENIVNIISSNMMISRPGNRFY